MVTAQAPRLRPEDVPVSVIVGERCLTCRRPFANDEPRAAAAALHGALRHPDCPDTPPSTWSERPPSHPLT